jgi:hypothetical protein
VHRALYGKVYFPVRSNGLKDIGHFLGAQWTAPNASGLQSLDVHFISSPPVKQRPACMAWADKRLAQIVEAEG